MTEKVLIIDLGKVAKISLNKQRWLIENHGTDIVSLMSEGFGNLVGLDRVNASQALLWISNPEMDWDEAGEYSDIDIMQAGSKGSKTVLDMVEKDPEVKKRVLADADTRKAYKEFKKQEKKSSKSK